MNAVCGWVVALGLTFTSSQTGVNAARELYAAAAFDEALTAFTRLAESDGGTPEEKRQIAEYRMYSLYALGRVADATTAAEAMVRRDPLARLPSADASPRIQVFYDGIRSRLLPELIRERYRAGRAELEQKKFATAAEQLSTAGRLIEEARRAKIADTSLEDLRVLIDGFLELSQLQRGTSSGDAKSPVGPTANAVATAAVPVAPRAKAFYDLADEGVIPPTAVQQALPEVPASLHAFVVAARRSMVVLLMISASGRVEKADVIVSVNPIYDRMVADAAAGWRYHPATKGGVPVAYQKVLAVTVQ